jgi:hypothetical protein
MQMTLCRSTGLAAVALGFMAASTADARPIHHHGEYLYPRATIDRVGDGTFQYRGGLAYGVARAPYAYDGYSYGYGGAGTGDFQLEGR